MGLRVIGLAGQGFRVLGLGRCLGFLVWQNWVKSLGGIRFGLFRKGLGFYWAWLNRLGSRLVGFCICV